MANSPAEMQATFDRALTLMRDGHLSKAISICRDVLKERPDDAKIRTLLGTALVRNTDFAQAERELTRVAATMPDVPKVHRELGNALLGLGRGDDAVACFQRVVELTPNKSVAHFDLSVALSKLGREKDAREAMEASFRLDPDRKELLIAAEQQRLGKFKEAEMTYRAVLRRDPKNVTATRLLGSLATEMGRYRLAIRLLKGATKLAPDFFGAWIDLARACIESEDFEAARLAVDKAIQLEPELPYPHMMLGNLLTKAGSYAEAADAFDTALQKQPDHGGSLAGLGHALKTIGRQEEAIDRYRKCTRAHPAFGEAYWSLANLKTFRFTDDEIVVMESTVDDESVREESRVNFNFALGKAYEDRGDYEQAFARYDRGNKLRRMSESYDPVHTEHIHDRIIDIINLDLVEKLRGSGAPDAAPIFIVGLPRSGSTLLEQILASHPQVEGTHELPDLARVIRTINQERPNGDTYPDALRHFPIEHLKELGQQYLRSTERHRTGQPFFTDKMPNNFASIGLIHLILPNATIINARRHPLDSCMGSYKQLFFKGQSFTYDLIELGEFYLQYQRLMDYWHQLLPGKVLDVYYEDMVSDQESQTRRLIEHCRLPWDDQCLRFYETERAVNTASSEQVRQPIYSKSIHSWRRFEPQLAPLIEVLEPLLEGLPDAQKPQSILGVN